MMSLKRLLGLLATVLGLSTTSACAQADEDSFREGMIPRLSKSLPGATLTAVPGEPLAITVKGGHLDGAQINLNRIYGYCLTATPADCEIQKDALINSVAVKIESPSRESLRLIVRAQDYVDWIQSEDAKSGRDGNRTIIRPLGGGLYAILAYRLSNGTGSVTADTLKDLNLSTDDAWALANSQTAKILPALPSAGQLDGGVILFQGHDLGSSLLINLPAWSKLAASVGPNLVVAAVSDELVFVGKMGDGPDFENLRKTVAEECSKQARCISAYLYRFRDGHWVIAE